MNRVAQKIKDARLKSGMSEKQLAKKCGLSVSYILQIETGKKIINEKMADKILAVLGEEIALVEFSEAKEEKPARVKKTQAAASFAVEPNEQWMNALEGVIKKFPIVDNRTKKTVGKKELPIIGKKVEGYHADKIMFVRASGNDMEAMRIESGDVVMVLKTREIQNNALYLLEMNNQRLIRKIRRENDKLRLSRDQAERYSELVPIKSVNLIGRCIRVEVSL